MSIGTARMAHLSLPNSELHLGVDFTHHARVREVVATPGTALLFPGEGSVEPHLLAHDPPQTLIVVDGTWAQARKVVHANAFLKSLPRIGIRPEKPSNYRIRKEPEEWCVSTIEAVVQVLGALEQDQQRFLPLLHTFDRMVDLQLQYASQNQDPSRYRRKTAPRQSSEKVDTDIAGLRARPADAVALYAESNAHPRDSGVPGLAELIHLAALRPQSGERFVALVAPRRVLARATPLHLELPAGQILAGESIESALVRFAAFRKPSDLFFGWGHYSLDLLMAEDPTPTPFFDLRPVAVRRLRCSPSGIDRAPFALGRKEPLEALGEGRAGRRLAVLKALFEMLVMA